MTLPGDNDQLLLLYAAAAADPGDTAFIEAVLAVDPDLRRRLEALLARRRVLFPPALWPVPARPLEAVAAWMDEGALAVGDVLTVRLPGTAPLMRPVLVRQTADLGAQILFPVDLDDWPVVNDLHRDGDRVLLDVVIDDPPGLQRYTVVLLPPDWSIDAALPEDLRWEPVQAALASGELLGATTLITVGPRRSR